MNYIAIWPGQPGGYQPTIANEMVQDNGVQARAKEALGEAVKHPNRPPKPRAARKPAKKVTA